MMWKQSWTTTALGRLAHTLFSKACHISMATASMRPSDSRQTPPEPVYCVLVAPRIRQRRMGDLHWPWRAAYWLRMLCSDRGVTDSSSSPCSSKWARQEGGWATPRPRKCKNLGRGPVDRRSKGAVSGERREAAWGRGGVHGVDCRQLLAKRASGERDGVSRSWFAP